MKHTQGEWHKINYGDELEIHSDTESEGFWLATVRTDYDAGIDKNEAIANAKLIAAAPDLLEACNIEDLVAELNHVEMPLNVMDMMLDKLKQTRAAIKKATE